MGATKGSGTQERTGQRRAARAEAKTRGGGAGKRRASRRGGAPGGAVEADPVWAEYRRTGDLELRNRLMERYLPLVRATAERIRRRLPQSVELGDLESAGIFGLRDAIEGFDLQRGVKFETYCTTRVRGAILDELRSIDWVPRLVRTRANQLDKAMHDLEADLGRQPTDRELAARLGLELSELDAVVKEATAVNVVSLSESWPGAEEEERAVRKLDVLEDRRQHRPLEQLHHRDFLAVAARSLTPKERLILLLYYFEEMTMREIGLTLGLSESRVCQLHTRIMNKLREQFERSRCDLLG
ncbi:MAG: RNA polymerase sigma factor [Planctomycetota bacterium]|nr:MAG: RNA polymerase sigma factor [Planctomycetota bacterium]